jgi:hypothetical protein
VCRIISTISKGFKSLQEDIGIFKAKEMKDLKVINMGGGVCVWEPVGGLSYKLNPDNRDHMTPLCLKL